MLQIEERKPQRQYLGFDKGANLAGAIERFMDKFGQEPQEALLWKNLLWLGPINPTPPLQATLQGLQGGDGASMQTQAMHANLTQGVLL